jgi:hypothetical protein
MFAYGNQNYGGQPYSYQGTQNPYMQRMQYQPQMYPQPVQQPQPMMQDGAVQARLVSGREEAVAAAVMPGSLFLFFDRASRKVYAKLIDPQTGMPDFREYAEAQPEQTAAPQYVTVEMFAQYQEGVERRLEALQASPKAVRKAVSTDE